MVFFWEVFPFKPTDRPSRLQPLDTVFTGDADRWFGKGITIGPGLSKPVPFGAIKRTESLRLSMGNGMGRVEKMPFWDSTQNRVEEWPIWIPGGREFEVLEKRCAGRINIENPWPQIQPLLLKLGHSASELEKLMPPAILELLEDQGNQTEETPESSNQTKRVEGVTLIRAAMLLNDNDGELAAITKKRWRNKKQPSLPKPIARNLQDSQEDLFEPSSLCEFIEAVGDPIPNGKPSFLKALSKCKIPGSRI